LEAIAASGSLAAAARGLGLSYMRAWTLVRTMNACFRKPLVASARGGSGRGGALLTPLGRRALRLYRSLEAAALRSGRKTWLRLRRLLR
jgi:molybdate transport system regulatory protein